MTHPWRRDLLGLILAFGFLYLLFLGRTPLANPDEGRYAEIPREMLATGDWVTPRLDAVNYFEKPPLVYWAVAGAQAAFGGGEFALRLVPALFGLGGVLLTYAAARRLFGREAGLASAVVLGSAVFYAALSRILILDMAVSVLVAATLFCFILGVRQPPGRVRRLFFLGLYAAAALATLTKGLMGFLLPGAVMLLWLAACRQWRRLLPLYLPSGLALFLLIAAPWHLLAAARNPTWAHFYFVHEHWERFTNPSHGRFHPWYWFIPILLGGLFPWVGWLWSGCASALAGGWKRRSEQADRWFFFIWAAFIFLFFSKSESKLAPYILPVFPPLAVLIGCVVGPAWRDNLWAPVRRGLGVFLALAALLALALAGAVAAGPFGGPNGWPPGLRVVLALSGLVLAAGVLAAALAIRRRDARAGLAAAALTSAAFLAVAAWGTNRLGLPSSKPVALWVRNHAQPGDRVFFYAGFFHDFLYYSQHSAGAVGFHGDEVELLNDPAAAASGRFIEKPEFLRDWSGPGRVLLVARRTSREAAVLMADPAFHYQLLLQTPDFYLLGNHS